MNRHERLRAEAQLLAVAYGSANYDNIALKWVHLPRFPLSPIWNKTYTELMIVLPEAYPDLPPDGFYLDKNLCTRHGGRTPDHYFQGSLHNPYADKGWAWYCLHLKGWRPSTSLKRGDNLLKFCQLIAAVLSQRGEIRLL